MYYAQIDLQTRVCGAVTETHAPIIAPHMIEIPSLDLSLLGKRYHPATGEFRDVLASRREAILQRLERIDNLTDKPRTRRELSLGLPATQLWVQTLDDEAKALRTELEGL